MVRTTAINIQQAIAGLSAKPHAIQLSTLKNQAIGERIAAFSLPVRRLGWVRMLGADKVKAVREQGEKLVSLLCDIAKSCRGNRSGDTAPRESIALIVSGLSQFHCGRDQSDQTI